jgi:hypothetical protein
MKKLIAILFLFSFAYAQNYPAFTPNHLYDKGINWSPSIKMTSRLAEWENLTKGAALNFSYHCYVSYNYPINNGVTLKTFYYNCRQWAAQLQAAGAQYCILTVTTGFGFNMFDQKTVFPVRLALYTGTSTQFTTVFPSGATLPTATKSDLEQGGNANFMQEFCYEMRRVGIEPILYIPVHVDWVRLGGNVPNGSVSFSDAPANLQNAFMNYFCAYLQELIIRFHIRYMWFDGPAFVDNANTHLMQKVYNAIKSVTGQNNPNECLVIANVFPGNEALDWPYDIRSLEYFIYGNHPTVFKNSLNINQINYYIPTEMVNTTQVDQTYYYQVLPGLTGYETIINQSQASLNLQYELTQQYHSRFSLWLQPDVYGNIPTSQLKLLTNLQ